MRSFNRGLAWPFLFDLPNRFPNMSQAMRWLVFQNMGYHAQTMQDDVRAAFQTFTKKPLQEAFGVDEYLPQNLFIEKDWRRSESYYYYGNAYFVDPDTKELYFRSYSVYADTSLTDRELSEIVYQKEDEKEEGTEGPAQFAYFESLESFHKVRTSRSQGYGIAEI